MPGFKNIDEELARPLPRKSMDFEIEHARQAIANQELIDRELGKRSLKERVQRFLRGENNFANMGKKLAVEAERLKLAELLQERRATGKRAPRKRSLEDRLRKRAEMAELVRVSEIPIIGRVISKEDADEARQIVKTIDAITARENKSKKAQGVR